MSKKTSKPVKSTKVVKKAANQQGRSVPWKWLVPLLVIAAIAVAAFTLLKPEETGLASQISVAQAAELRDSGAFVLDVREVDEWNQLHVPGATLIPLGELASRVNEVPRDQTVVVMCRSGNRSQEGRDILKAAGFENVTSMSGGIIQWSAAGYETVTGP
ncbi:MAG: rhodanese-like domain-containing protein [Anaerolineaceae bacterium]|nr:rhodanese-like domain-containing protein [Anaerolineaceae bacterium]